MNNLQRKHILVKLANAYEGEDFIDLLESKGLANVQNITFDKLNIKVLAVGKKEFFALNATCLAALANSGVKPISVEEFKDRFNLHSEITNSL